MGLGRQRWTYPVGRIKTCFSTSQLAPRQQWRPHSCLLFLKNYLEKVYFTCHKKYKSSFRKLYCLSCKFSKSCIIFCNYYWYNQHYFGFPYTNISVFLIWIAYFERSIRNLALEKVTVSFVEVDSRRENIQPMKSLHNSHLYNVPALIITMGWEYLIYHTNSFSFKKHFLNIWNCSEYYNDSLLIFHSSLRSLTPSSSFFFFCHVCFRFFF